MALLLAAPSMADSIFPNEGEQFSGVVDSSPSCGIPITATINWGDGSSSAGTTGGGSVSGTHTYGEEGTYSGTVDVVCDGTSASDPLSADVPDAALSASGKSVDTTATQSFSGTVATFTDADPGGTASDYVATIDWGDGTSSSQGTTSGASGGPFSVNGSHTYATSGTYSIFVTITDQSKQGGTGGQSHSTAFTSGTATVAKPPPQFRQCPPVGADTGCQFLIVYSNSGKTIFQDPGQGPYENAEDALIGIVNNSSQPIYALPLSAPGLFSFEADGICNPNGAGPVAPGCVPPKHSPSGQCGVQLTNCSFPAPGGQPFGYKEPGAVFGNTQNGYEGPTTWFSNVSRNLASGHVNFSPPVQPGHTTYFALEEPPSASALKVGSRTNVSLPRPINGVSYNIKGLKGLIFALLPARYRQHPAGDPGATDALAKGAGFVQVTEPRQLPMGTEIDARRGSIQLVSASGRGTKTQTGTFSGALFGTAQDRRGASKGLMTLSLVEGAFRGAPSFASCPRRAADVSGPSAYAALSSRVLQALHARAHGRFRTRGRFSSATVRGTAWGERDRCDGTLTIVRRGTVAVSDFVRHVTVLVHAGHTYLARAPRSRHR